MPAQASLLNLSAVPDVFEPCELHIPRADMAAVVADLYMRRLYVNMQASDFDHQVSLRLTDTVSEIDILNHGARVYVHGEPVQPHYRWMQRGKVLECKMFGPEPDMLLGTRIEYVRLGETQWYVEEMMRGEVIQRHGRNERRMVLNTVCVNG